MVLSHMSVSQLDALVYGQGSYTVGYVGHIPAVPSLCIPALNLEDGPEGVADGMTGVTQLPAAVSAAATWDRSTLTTYGKVIGKEQAGKGTNVDLGPTVNIVRDPRWGRAFESYGEDPYLSGQLAAAEITGVQSKGVMAMVKHWAVYNQETNRNTQPTTRSSRIGPCMRSTCPSSRPRSSKAGRPQSCARTRPSTASMRAKTTTSTT